MLSSTAEGIKSAAILYLESEKITSPLGIIAADKKKHKGATYDAKQNFKTPDTNWILCCMGMSK